MSTIEIAAQRWKGCDILVVSPTPSHPQDFGNRKRVFEVCNELKRQGARIHFVHYASENEWLNDRPRSSEREMIAAWDTYQLIAPSRAIHRRSIGRDHLIDEWADPDLGHYISWACRTQSIDVVIVNYTWMSFCFYYVAEGIFKICDTHDVCGGRRELLERNGIRPEFFHTTPSQEARGLARADLVWAIKGSEQRYFENDLGLPNCLTVLHGEPKREWWTGPPSIDGWLRAGIIGARNNINKQNFTRFLNDALPIIDGYMAPVKIVIAGSCANDFKHLRHPNVEVVGRVTDLGEFYRSVDVVIAPMDFGTGLKIKVAEALAAGAPLLATAHATEGYPTTEPLHLLPDFQAMALELVKLAFDPKELPALACRSRAIHADIRPKVLAALEETRCRLMAYRQNSMCIVLPMAALDERTLLHDHLASAIDYLRSTVSLQLYVVGPAVNADPKAHLRFGHQIKVFASPGLVAELGAGTPEDWTPMRFGSLLETWQIRQAYFLCDDEGEIHPGTEIRPGAEHLSRAFVRYDAVELSGGHPGRLIDRLRRRAWVTVMSSTIGRAMIWRSQHRIEGVVQVGFRRLGPFHSLPGDGDRGRQLGLVIMGKRTDPLAAQTLALGASLGCAGIIIDPDDPDMVRAPAYGPEAELTSPSVTEARLVVDLTVDNSVSAILGEAGQCVGIPVIRLRRGLAAAVLHSGASPLFPTSIGRLLRTVARGLLDPGYLEMLRDLSQQDLSSRNTADAGWIWLGDRLSGASGTAWTLLA